ncbi:hypothetical protein ACWATR_39755, partial [Nostoc sp. UIC 10890]
NRHTIQGVKMEPTISIPRDWKYPHFMLNQQTNRGLIVGMIYIPKSTSIANCIGSGWQYSVLIDNNARFLKYFEEKDLWQSDKRESNLCEINVQQINQPRSNLCQLLVLFNNTITQISADPEYKTLLETGFKLDRDIEKAKNALRNIYLANIRNTLDDIDLS